MIKKLVIKDADGKIVTNAVGTPEDLAVYEEGNKFKYPSGYTTEYSDPALDAEWVIKEAQKLSKKVKKEALRAIDWSKVKTIADIKAIVQELVDQENE